MSHTAPTPLRLIGNPEENFYILGKKHFSQFRQLQKLLTPGLDSWSNRLKNLSQTLLAKKVDTTAHGA